MTTSAALLGTVDEKNISLGAMRWFVAPYSTYIDETVQFSTNNPPSPFLDLGISKPEVSFNFVKNLFKFKNGVPSALKLQFVTDIEGGANITLDQFSGANLGRALFNTAYAFKKFAASPAIVQCSAAPTGNVVHVTSSTGYLENGYIALASAPSGLAASISEYRIVEILGNDLILHRDVAETFTGFPYIGVIKSWKVPYGSAIACRVGIVGVFQDLDGRQFIMGIPNGVIEGNFSDGIEAKENNNIALSISGEAFYDVDRADNVIANFIKIN